MHTSLTSLKAPALLFALALGFTTAGCDKIPGFPGGNSSEDSSEDSNEDSDEDSNEDSDEDSNEDSDEDSNEDSDEDTDEDSDEDTDEDSDEDTDEDSDEDTDEDSDEDTDEDSDEDTDEDTPDATTTGGEPSEDTPEDNPGNGRDCSKIQWGSSYRRGTVVPLDPTKGYLDENGDGKIDASESATIRDVDNCQLHLSGKKCAIITAGDSGCPNCPARYAEVSRALRNHPEIAYYAIYQGSSLEAGFKSPVGPRTNQSVTMYSGKYTLFPHPHRPYSALINLETMEAVIGETAGELTEVSEFIRLCKNL